MELSWEWLLFAWLVVGWSAFVYLLGTEVGITRAERTARKRAVCARCGRSITHPSRLYTDCLSPVRDLTPDSKIK